MSREKIKEFVGFVCLGLCVMGFLVFLFYKLIYAPYHDLPTHRIESFANMIMICQSIVLELACLSLIKDLADEKSWLSQALIYVFAFIVMYGITGGIMTIVDLLSGRPFVIL